MICHFLFGNDKLKEVHMLTKTTIALAAALTLGVTSAALAARSGTRGGFRELGPGGTASAGVNPAEHRSLGGAKVELIMSDGKCWQDNHGANYYWGNCRR
jgi:hypothetical protein